MEQERKQPQWQSPPATERAKLYVYNSLTSSKVRIIFISFQFGASFQLHSMIVQSFSPRIFFYLNSYSSEQVPFYPVKGNTVTWYICGPTVYDSSHLGHARYKLLSSTLPLSVNA
jgi:hypothetical protein